MTQLCFTGNRRQVDGQVGHLERQIAALKAQHQRDLDRMAEQQSIIASLRQVLREETAAGCCICGCPKADGQPGERVGDSSDEPKVDRVLAARDRNARVRQEQAAAAQIDALPDSELVELIEEAYREQPANADYAKSCFQQGGRSALALFRPRLIAAINERKRK